MNGYITTTERSFFPLLKLKKYLKGHKGYIAGGCFKNIFNGEKVKDIDIFFYTEDDFLKALKYFNSHTKYKIKYENNNCVAYRNIITKVTIELVRAQFGPPQSLLNNFDFTIVQAAYHGEITPEGNKEYYFTYLWRFFEDLHLRKIVIDGNIGKLKFPANTFDRALKYQKYGYGMCKESKIKLINSLRTLDDNFDINKSLYNGYD
jgi:hypothetical protein